MRKTYRLGVLAACSIGFASGQSFEVASIRPHPLPPGALELRLSTVPGPPTPLAIGNHFIEKTATLQDLIQDAYGVMQYQLIGLTDWEKAVLGEHFDVDARSPGETPPTADQLRAMLQNLLSDRFQLKVHEERREMPVYALVIAEGGLKMKRLTGDGPIATVDPGLVLRLSKLVDRPVLDKTGLTGRYDFEKPGWDQIRQQFREDRVAGMASSFTAVREQLGLKLEPRKEPMDVIVIDRAERPSAN